MKILLESGRHYLPKIFLESGGHYLPKILLSLEVTNQYDPYLLYIYQRDLWESRVNKVLFRAIHDGVWME